MPSRPDYGKAWWLLADLKNYVFSDEELEAMQAAIAGPVSPADRFHLHFAVGRALRAARRASGAFGHYADRQRHPPPRRPMKAKSGQASRPGHRHLHARILCRRAKASATTARPPSSSSACIGRARLSSSRSSPAILQIEATAELPIIAQLLRSVGLDQDLGWHCTDGQAHPFDKEQAQALGAEYLDRARHYRATAKPRFVDKMPANWLHLGFIRLILPNATIIDARRHPMAAGFSNFRQNYGSGVAGLIRWPASAATIATTSASCGTSTASCRARYIASSTSASSTTSSLRCAGCSAMSASISIPPALEFHRSDRPYARPAPEQVRQPVNREGVDQWRAFEPWLGPLKGRARPGARGLAGMIYFEDMEVGAERVFGFYDVTREEVLEFARKYDPQPFHLSDEAAAKTHFGRLAASGWLTCAMTMASDRPRHLRGPARPDRLARRRQLRWLKPVCPRRPANRAWNDRRQDSSRSSRRSAASAPK